MHEAELSFFGQVVLSAVAVDSFFVEVVVSFAFLQLLAPLA